jgi:hypothetical protein
MYLFFLFNNFNIRRSTKKKAPNINRVRKAILRTLHTSMATRALQSFHQFILPEQSVEGNYLQAGFKCRKENKSLVEIIDRENALLEHFDER